MKSMVLFAFVVLSASRGMGEQATAQDPVAENALSAFSQLCGEKSTREIFPEDSSAIEVFRLDQPEDLTQPLSWDASSDSFIVPVVGRLFRTIPPDFVPYAAAGTLERLNQSSAIYGQWEEGIIGQVYCETDGQPYRVMEFDRPSLFCVGIKVSHADVVQSITDKLGECRGNIRLLDVGYRLYVWEYTEAQTHHFVDAMTGTYFTEEAFDAAVRETWAEVSAVPPGLAGTSSSFSLAPVAREQFMYQTQNGRQCWPTSMSMAFDFFGQRISHEDVADVATDPSALGTTMADACRAAMFSHNSVPHAGWCCHTGTCPLSYGYNERTLAYSAVYDYFSDNTAFNCVKELTREHTPILARVSLPTSSHIVIVWGYYEVNATENYLSVFDPYNYGNPDTPQIGQDWWRWESDPGQPDRKHNFAYYWSSALGCFAMVVSPLRVNLGLTYDSTNDRMNLTASVRTCWPFPTADTGDTSWDSINLGRTLSGDAVNNEPLEVMVSYPSNVNAPNGNNPYTFTASGPDAHSAATWSFDASDPDIHGATFSVSFTGWARGFSSDSYTNQTDELGGSASFTLDKSLFRITNADSDTVGAIGDQGNLYLAGSLSEFEDSISQNSGAKELYIRHGSENPVCLFSGTGSAVLAGLAHRNMNDVGDTCTGVQTDASRDEGSTSQKWMIADYTRLPPNPSGDNFYVRVHDEVMRVTDSGPNYSPTTNIDFITVVRGQEGTSAAAHQCGSQIRLYGKGDLQSSINSFQTSLTLETGDAGMFPSDFLLARRFPVRIDSEYMLVTSVSQDTFTVARGWHGSTPATHAAAADVLLAPELVYDEQYHLDHPSGKYTFRIRNAEQETVAYVDDEGQMRLRGYVFESFDGWGLWE